MRAIAVINQKGGVGKTTTTVNLGAALLRLGFRVLLIDLDPQANMTIHLNVDPSGVDKSVYDVLCGKSAVADVMLECAGLSVVPSHIDLAGAEVELVSMVGRETILRDKLATLFADREKAGEAPFDFVLIDCPPSLGLLSLNALTFAGEVIIPMQTEYFALQGMTKLMDVVELVRSRLNPDLHISAIVPCRYDPRTNLAKEVLDEILRYFGDKVTKTRIRSNVRLAEAPSHGETVLDYDPESKGAADYLCLATELTGVAMPTPAVERLEPAVRTPAAGFDDGEKRAPEAPRPDAAAPAAPADTPADARKP